MRTGFVTALLLAVVAATTEAQTLNLTERLVFRDGDAPTPAAGWQMTAEEGSRVAPGTSAIV
jgi:hypothetical protein